MRSLVPIALIVACGGQPGLQEENDALRARVAVLESQNQALRRQIRVASRSREQPEPELPEPEEGMLVVSVLADESLQIGGRTITDEQLVQIVRTAGSELRVTIAAASGVRYARVVEVIDLLRENGIRDFALNPLP